MAFCINCGNQIPDNAKFCPNCGQSAYANQSNARVVFDGTVYKCPSCGEVLSSFVSRCPTCGYELRSIHSPGSIKEFAERLYEAGTESKKIDIIQGFPVPNTKEDIFEFMILAASVFGEGNTTIDKPIVNAWLSKVEQCHKKAALLFSDDKDSYEEAQKLYNQTKDKIYSASRAKMRNSIINTLLRTIGFWAGLIVFFLAFIFDIKSRINTSLYHIGASAIMIVGAFMIGRKQTKMIDAGVGVICGILSILLGTLLQEKYRGNGSLMELAGAATIIIVIVQLVRSAKKK